MEKYKIVADSAANLIDLTDVAFASVPLSIQADEIQYLDTPDLDVDQMIQALQNYKGTSSTACPNIHQWCEAFAGAEVVFAVTLTSALSGSYSSALQAKEIYQEEHPETKIYVIDSLSAGPEMTLLLEKIAELIKQGLSPEEIVDQVQKYQQHTHLLFSLESLENLANNGRISHTMATFAHMFKIRVIGMASAKGELDPVGKARGEKKAFSLLLKTMEEKGFKGHKVRLVHCQNQAGALALQEKILEAHPTSQITITKSRGLCSYYAEQGGIMIGFEA